MIQLKDTYRLGIYEKAFPVELNWKEKLSVAQECGFDYIEMSVDESAMRLARLDWTEEQIQEVLDAEKCIGIPIETICLSAQRKYPLGSCLPETEEKAMEVLKKAILFAKKMGIRMIQTQGYDCYYGEITSNRTKEAFFRNLEKGTMFAAQHGVVLAMETMENEFMNTIEKAMYYINEINSPYLQVYPDVGNISNATEYVCRDIRMGKGHIAAAHLKETVAGKFREIPYGNGQVDFPSAISTLYSQGVRRFVAEFWNCGESNWKEIVIENRRFLDEQFDKAMLLLNR